MVASHHEADETAVSASAPLAGRRRILKLATATVALSSLPLASASTAEQSSTAASASDFAAVSQFLTGKSTLDAGVQDALFRAFMALDPAFAAKLAKLRTAIAADNITPENLHATLSASDPDLAKVPQEILTGWYLGVAGSGKRALCVTYANDLANAAVADVLSPPSYAYGPCNSWAEKPV